MQFEFATAAQIIFGPGKLETVGQHVTGMGRRVLLVWGCPQEISSRLRNLLTLSGISIEDIKTSGEPTVDSVGKAVSVGRQMSANIVIGLGGGSTIDTAKAAAAMLTNPGKLTDYLEVIGLNLPLTIPSLPLIAIPTTAGTGSEVTRNAVIGAPEHNVKVSLRSPYLLPRIALVDPELTLSLNPEITAFTGMDALTQLIEPITSNRSNPLTDAVCIEGLKHIGRSLSRAYENGRDLSAREDMSLASLFSGIALANAKLGAVHGLAGPIGGEISAPHGAICASLLPLVVEANVNALRDRTPDHPALNRYAVIACLLTGNSEATSSTAIQWIKDICSRLKIPPLSVYGLAENQFPAIIEKAKKASSMQGNPITLFDDELRNILQRSL